MSTGAVEMAADRAGDMYVNMGRPAAYAPLMTRPSSVASSTSHPSNDCDSEPRASAVPVNGEIEAAIRRNDHLVKSFDNSFTDST